MSIVHLNQQIVPELFHYLFPEINNQISIKVLAIFLALYLPLYIISLLVAINRLKWRTELYESTGSYFINSTKLISGNDSNSMRQSMELNPQYSTDSILQLISQPFTTTRSSNVILFILFVFSSWWFFHSSELIIFEHLESMEKMKVITDSELKLFVDLANGLSFMAPLFLLCITCLPNHFPIFFLLCLFTSSIGNSLLAIYKNTFTNLVSVLPYSTRTLFFYTLLYMSFFLVQQFQQKAYGINQTFVFYLANFVATFLIPLFSKFHYYQYVFGNMPLIINTCVYQVLLGVAISLLYFYE